MLSYRLGLIAIGVLMSEIQIKGERKTVVEMFSRSFLFRVPLYQRPYSWRVEHSTALLTDLLEAVREEPDIARCEPYFLGTIVLVKEEGKAEADILDGQQRLTTVTILLSVLSQCGDVPVFAKSLLQYLYDEADPSRLESKASYRLTLRNQDATFFRKYIQEPGGLSDMSNLHEPSLSDSQRKIIATAKEFKRRVEALSAEEKQKLGLFLINKCVLIVVSTPNDEAGFRIFRILNDRGMPLSLPDILKADVIGKILPPEQVDYNSQWEELERVLGIESFEELFMQIRMIYRQTRSRDARKEFRDSILSKFKDVRKFIDDVLVPFSDAYMSIRQVSYKGERKKEIQRLLKWLNRIDHQDWLPPAILIMQKYKNDPSLLIELLTMLERLAATLFILNKNVNKRVEYYKRILSEFFDVDEAKPRTTIDMSKLKAALEITDVDKMEMVTKLNSDVYENPKACEYMLLRLDYAHSDNPPDYDDMKIITIEHVLPQTPSPSSEWKQHFSDAEQQEYTHKLGNLVLLTKKKNSKSQNFDFKFKKERYFDTDSYTSFRITQQVKSESEWTPEVVKRRQQIAVSKLSQVWSLT